MDVLGAIRDSVRRNALLGVGETVVVGVSGGPDSLCLLHALRTLADELRFSLHVGHLDHGTRNGESRADAEFVSDLCAAWGVACALEHADVPAIARERGISFEEAARQERYRFLGDLARRVGARSVAVAHHAGDQVETVLMHFLRGSGLGGLQGMRPVSWLDDLRIGREARQHHAERVRLIRPLLDVPREDIEAYCLDHGLEPRFDCSNLDVTYFRNRLRHELIPLLEGYNPNLRQAVRRMAEVVAGDHAVLQELVDETWAQVVVEASDRAVVYGRSAFGALSLGLQRSLLRRGIHHLRFSLRNIDWIHVEDAVRVACTGRVGAEATLPHGLVLRVGYDDLVLTDHGRELARPEGPRVDRAMRIAGAGVHGLADGWRLQIRCLSIGDVVVDWQHNRDRYVAYLDAGRLSFPLVLRPRQEGDRFHPLGLADRRQKVSDFMINARVPRGVRGQVPLLVSDGCIAWIVGWRIDARFAVTESTQEIAIVSVFYHSPDGVVENGA